MKRVLVGVLGALLFCTEVLAQDQRIFSQFFMNPYVYNPAYAGVEGHMAFYGLYRTQYIGLEGAPTLSHVNFHTPLKNNLAMGGLVYNETEGPLNTSGGKVTMGYMLEVDDKHYVRFGMSVGGGYTGYDQDYIGITNDPTLAGLSGNSFVTADFGVAYHFDHFNIGFALPNLISRDVISSETFAPISLNPLNNMMIKANYRGHINDNFAIEPHVIYRFSNVNLPQYEITTLVHIMHMAWAGASYRQDAGFAGLVGIKVKDNFGIGFAYELGTSELSDVTSGTAEIHMGFHLGEKKKHHKHSHSFLKSHRLSHEERKRIEARKERLAEYRKEQAEKKAAEAKAAREAKAAVAAGVAVAGSNSADEQKSAPKENISNNQPFESAKLDRSVPLEERTNADGTKEYGATYNVTLEDGTVVQEMRWSKSRNPILKEEVSKNTPVKERILENGTKQIGTTYYIMSASGKVRKEVRWTDAATEIAQTSVVSDEIDESAPIQERTNADGKTEYSITHVVTNSDGTTSTEIEWTTTPPAGTESVTAQPVASSTGGEMINSNTARKGHHILELPVGHHVVAAQFKEFQEAEDYSDTLFERGFHGTIVGYVSAVGEYFVVVHKGATPEQAEEEQKRWSQRKDLDHVYIFNVVE